MIYILLSIQEYCNDDLYAVDMKTSYDISINTYIFILYLLHSNFVQQQATDYQDYLAASSI